MVVDTNITFHLVYENRICLNIPIIIKVNGKIVIGCMIRQTDNYIVVALNIKDFFNIFGDVTTFKNQVSRF